MKVCAEQLPNLLQNLIQRESPDLPGNERKIAEFITEYFQNREVTVEWDEFQKDRINIIARITSTHEKPALIFSAHMDTLPVGSEQWEHYPFGGERVGERIYGRGASDMKSGLASMITAFLALKEKKRLLKGDLILALSAGESTFSLGAKRFIEKDRLSDAGACVVGEPSSMKMFIAQKGAVWLNLKFQGKGGHSSGNLLPNAAPINAIDLAQNYTHRLKRARFSLAPHPLLGDTTWSVNQIMGGTMVNMVPDSCEMKVDVRTLPNQKSDEIAQIFRSISQSNMKIDVIGVKEPVESKPDDPFVLLCQQALESVMKAPVKPEGVSYFSDAAVICPALKIPMVIIGAGELGMTGQKDEWASVKNMELAAKVYYKIAKKYLM